METQEYNTKTTRKSRLWELARLFLKLGTITFGGPAVHIAIFEDEVVKKRKWMTHQQFLDLVGATNLIPGPNSTEMAMHTGYNRAGIAGLIIAGISFTIPAVLTTYIIAYFYSLYGNLPDVKPFLYGIKPAVIILILSAVFRLGSKTITSWKIITIGIAVAAANFAGLNEILSILTGGVLGAFFLILSEKAGRLNSFSALSILSLGLLNPLFEVFERSETSLFRLFISCLKIGAVWFGSGYVLVAYFDGEFVQGLNWLTRQELLDAIAVGQFTPGPFLSSATFIGYQMAGTAGAFYATIGITLPSFIFVAVLNPLVPRLRKSNFLSKFLDSVNVSALAVMLVVAVKLATEVLADWQNWIIAAVSFAAFFSIKKLSPVYIILAGAFLGYLFYVITK